MARPSEVHAAGKGKQESAATRAEALMVCLGIILITVAVFQLVGPWGLLELGVLFLVLEVQGEETNGREGKQGGRRTSGGERRSDMARKATGSVDRLKTTVPRAICEAALLARRAEA